MRRLGPLVAIILGLVACTGGDTTDTSTPATTTETGTTPETDPPLQLVLIWHQHQPLYPKDADGVITRPWVRVHATKDYLDMAAMVEEHPGVTATFNLTPVLLLQLEELAAGAKDAYWVASEIPAAELTDEEKAFIATRFFDVNPTIIARFPRFQELADDRARIGVDGAVDAWSPDDFRDLQVLFNLAWTDPDYLAVTPLRELTERGRDYLESDKPVLFDEHLRIIREVIPLHARLWEEGRIEVTTTPLAHPILPLLVDTDLALVGDSTAVMPGDRFREVADADLQVRRGLETAERLLGQSPQGMWPGEGAVAQEAMNLFSKNGVRWVATGEAVLAQTLGLGSFERDSNDTVLDAETLYRPYSAKVNQRDPVAMFFRDTRLSDMVGFEYSGMDAATAVQDFMTRLRAVYDSVDAAGAAASGRPAVVSVVLDGENAWEHYPNDGKDFLNGLYEELARADWVETTTPTAYLERFGDLTELRDVFPASWFQPNFATWIGEEEEATAWEYLAQVRQDLRRAEQSGSVIEDDIEAAIERMLFAEGSDWFWWYGDDQDSGDDGYFDAAFRELLGQVYDAIGSERPSFLSVPIIPERAVEADRVPAELISIEVDGLPEGAWDEAGEYRAAGVRWAFDKQNLYLRYDGDVDRLASLYIGVPRGAKTATSSGGAVLGFGSTHVVLFEPTGPVLCSPLLDREHQDCPLLESGRGPRIVELAIPLAELGAVGTGDVLYAKSVVDDELVPGSGPLAFQVPDVSDVTVLLEVSDPSEDDYGPGTYTYPVDSVFVPGSFDLTSFSVGTEGEDVVFDFAVAAPIANPWGSPSGLALQTLDVYIDLDPGQSTGARLGLPGRNAALEQSNGWDYALTIEGWQPTLYTATADGSIEETDPSMSVLVFGDQGRVVVRLPASLLGGGDPSTWGYSVALLSQEGFPSPGVRRVRDVGVVAEQWVGGGAPNDISHTRIFDLVWPEVGLQEDLFSDYVATADSIEDLGPDDFAQLPLLRSEP
jgi:alpha-amylase/alpha-mannosidase (GH57 family)